MRILAMGDLHGRHYDRAERLIRACSPDWIVLVGDILPDFGMISGRDSRAAAQRSHWATYHRKFEKVGARTLFVRGNHEVEGFAAPDQQGIPPALQGRVLRLEGVPAEFGAFGFAREMDRAELERELRRGLASNPVPRIVVSHAPPHGVLDEVVPGRHIGHVPLANFLSEPEGHGVDLVLCGHVHEGFGASHFGRAIVCNLAQGFALLEDAGAGWTRLDQRTFLDLQEDEETFD